MIERGWIWHCCCCCPRRFVIRDADPVFLIGPGKRKLSDPGPILAFRSKTPNLASRFGSDPEYIIITKWSIQCAIIQCNCLNFLQSDHHQNLGLMKINSWQHGSGNFLSDSDPGFFKARLRIFRRVVSVFYIAIKQSFITVKKS